MAHSCQVFSVTMKEMSVDPDFEGLQAIVVDVTHNGVRELVPDLNPSVDEGPAGGTGPRYRLCKCVGWHSKASSGCTSEGVRLGEHHLQACWACVSVHFVQECRSSHLATVLKGWDIQCQPGFLFVCAYNFNCPSLNRIQKTQRGGRCTHPAQ